VEPIDACDLVVVERKVGEVNEFVKAFNDCDVVEGQVEPFEAGQVVDVLYFFDNVIVQLQFLQAS
jgi:hypothetical protein